MVNVLIISILTIILIILSSIFFREVRIKNKSISLYWIIAFFGALLLIIFGYVDINELTNRLTSDTSINPIKIILLFISMTVISISLDELGFFRYISRKVLNKTKGNQTSVFLSIYFLVAFLTVFTSNDIVILTLTPFIISYSKEAKVSPIPYLVSEFFSANTWSMLFLIGNPTNIYLTQVYNIGFIEYLKVMFLPTVFSGLIELLLLYLLFRKKLKEPICNEYKEVTLSNKGLVIINLIILAISTILLSISSYLNIEMYLISIIMMVILLISIILYHLIKHYKDGELVNVVKRAPYELIPFVLSMYVIVLSLEECGVTLYLSNIFNNYNATYAYGITSFLSANLLNNIPMTMFYSSILKGCSQIGLYKGIYASIVGSNLGAILTPLGALAGIMWMNILKKDKIDFSFIDFIKYGAIVSIPLIFVSIIALELVL